MLHSETEVARKFVKYINLISIICISNQLKNILSGPIRVSITYPNYKIFRSNSINLGLSS